MVDPATIDRLALLARIALTPAEKERLQKDLEAILGYVSDLQHAPAPAQQSETATAYAINILRPDVPSSAGHSEGLLAAAPARDGNYFKVKKILG